MSPKDVSRLPLQYKPVVLLAGAILHIDTCLHCIPATSPCLALQRHSHLWFASADLVTSEAFVARRLS
jgi:hypothetical protein